MHTHAHLDLSWESIDALPGYGSSDSYPEQLYAPAEATWSGRAELTQGKCWRKAISSNDHFFPFFQAFLLEKFSLKKHPRREFLKCYQTLTMPVADCTGYGLLTQDKPARLV